MKANELLDKAKRGNLKTDSDLARHLGINRSMISMMRTGSKAMPDKMAIRLATLAGLDEADTLTAIHAEQADDETRKVWKEIAKRTATS